MTEEENILKIIIEKQSWEEIIYYVVNVENLDPWNIDLVKLTNGFLKFLHEAKELDFRIPAKIVFVAAILLRLKSNYLSIFEEEEPEENLEQKPMIYEEPPELLALLAGIIKSIPFVSLKLLHIAIIGTCAFKASSTTL
jgi:chromatin segregation and condensation protein Rec8/ScpA/Scc1 (kleisin family)